jgi:hypothetical protein
MESVLGKSDCNFYHGAQSDARRSSLRGKYQIVAALFTISARRRHS